jgi:hypothetical protein
MESCIFCGSHSQMYKYEKEVIQQKIRVFGLKNVDETESSRKQVFCVCTTCRHKYGFVGPIRAFISR